MRACKQDANDSDSVTRVSPFGSAVAAARTSSLGRAFSGISAAFRAFDANSDNRLTRGGGGGRMVAWRSLRK